MSEERGLGIDPGTGSFDLCGIQGGEVFFEESLDSEALAREPEKLVEAVEGAEPLDLIAGPSGYGVEVTHLEDLDVDSLRRWYLTYILLLKEGDLESALERGDPGIMVYQAMTESAVEMKRRGLPVCYIPGVVNLETVPAHRKVNNVDMGTVDKLCAALLGVHDQANRLGISYSEVSFVFVEMGAGYNAALAVDGGRIVDGVGGTMGGIGFLSPGGVDMEMVQLGGSWSKSDVFTGGVSAITGEESPDAFVEKRDSGPHRVAWDGMMEGVEKSVASLTSSVEPEEVLLSGRLTGIDEVERDARSRLGRVAPVRRVSGLPGASEVKEAAQGYGMAAEGLAGGSFSSLVEHLGLGEAEGTALDHLFHPTGRRAAERLKEEVPFST